MAVLWIHRLYLNFVSKKLVSFALVAASWLHVSPMSALAQFPTDDEPILARMTHCKDLPKVFASDESEEGLYRYAVWIQDCISDEIVLVAGPQAGEPFEVNRRCMEAGTDQDVRLVNLGTAGPGIGTTSWSEPSVLADHYTLDVYSLNDRRRLLRAWSYDPPIIENLDEDPATEFVIFKDSLHINEPVVNGWPMVLQVESEGVSVSQLKYFPRVVQKQLSDAEWRLAELDGACPVLSDPCIWAPTIQALRTQIKALRSVLRGW